MGNPDIRLLVTDLDGTVIGHRDDRAIYPAFKDLLGGVRRDQHLQWMVVTGRSYGSFCSYTRSWARVGIHADLVVTGHGCVFSRHAKGYRFNLVDTVRLARAAVFDFAQARRALKRIHRHLLRHVRGVRRVLQLKDRFTLRFATRESAEDAMHWVTEQIQEIPALQAVRKDREIEVAHIAARKARAVCVLAKRLNVSRDTILAIGDSRADLCMLDPRVASHVGCPINADEETQQAVHAYGGHISEAFTLAGVIDVIQSTLNGTVSSVIPPLPEEMPRRRRSASHVSRTGSRDRKYQRRSYLLGAAILAITLIVFASFDIIPFAGLIMKPIHLVFRLCEGIWVSFR